MVERRILVVDDEEAICAGLRSYLVLEGYDVDTAMSAEEALGLDIAKYDLILLDIMMGKMSGTEFVSVLKRNSATASVPVIFLTAKNDEDDMVSGLKLGADDYITKPFSVKNVMARIEVVLRRAQPKEKIAGVSCDRTSMICMVNGSKIKLPRKEFELLDLLINNPGRIFTREELLARIWPEHTVVVDRAVDVHITRLRSKIAPYGKRIVTRSGYGYGWQD